MRQLGPTLGPTDRVRQRRRFARRERLASFIIVSAAALGVVQFFRPVGAAARGPFSRLAASEARFVRAVAMGGHAEASRDAFGRSGEVRMRFALPGSTLEFPLAVGGDPRTLRYEWLRLGDTTAADSSQPLRGANVMSPRRPGFYRLAVRQGTEREVMTEPIVAVLMPFQRKVGGMLNGYRIGTYLTERLAARGLGQAEHPEGFLEVGADHVGLNVSTHLTLGDFITRDSQEDIWPKYVAINPRLLDKLELVIAEVQRRRGRVRAIDLALGVHSGFRTPWHNARVPRAAGDSRHQYGDAADVVMDANGDGRITAADGMLVASAVERVEYEHPDLAGGLGLYTGRQYRTPYVHIDTRGTPARWRGGVSEPPPPPEPDVGLLDPTSGVIESTGGAIDPAATDEEAPAGPGPARARPLRTPRPTR